MSDWLKPRVERRVHGRRRTIRGAKIIFNDNEVVAECTVRDLSDSGAKLTFKTVHPLPKCFRVLINEIGIFDCEIMRVSGLDCGVRFLGQTALSPSLAQMQDSAAAINK